MLALFANMCAHKVFNRMEINLSLSKPFIQLYPATWPELRLLLDRSVATFLSFIADILRVELTNENHDHDLWQQYFNATCAFVAQDELQLERMQKELADDILLRLV
jgi:hypothetical protein